MFLIRIWLLSLECVWTYRVDQMASAMGVGKLWEETGDSKASGMAFATSQKWGTLFCFTDGEDALSLLLCHVLHPRLHVSVNLKVKGAQSCLTLYDPMDYTVHGLNPGLPHCRQILYQLSCKGSPGILEWVAYPFSSGSSWPSSWTRVSCSAGGFFFFFFFLPIELSGKAQCQLK